MSRRDILWVGQNDECSERSIGTFCANVNPGHMRQRSCSQLLKLVTTQIISFTGPSANNKFAYAANY